MALRSRPSWRRSTQRAGRSPPARSCWPPCASSAVSETAEADRVERAVEGELQPPVAVEEQQQPERDEDGSAADTNRVVVVAEPPEAGQDTREADAGQQERERDPGGVEREQRRSARDRPGVPGQHQDAGENGTDARRRT